MKLTPKASDITEVLEHINNGIRSLATDIYPQISWNQTYWILNICYFVMGILIAVSIYRGAKAFLYLGSLMAPVFNRMTRTPTPKEIQIRAPIVEDMQASPLRGPIIKLKTLQNRKMKSLRAEINAAQSQIQTLLLEKAKLQEDFEGLHHLWEVSLAEIKDLRTKHQSLIERALIVAPKKNSAHQPVIGTPLEFIDTTHPEIPPAKANDELA